jgi:hypothetical protein
MTKLTVLILNWKRPSNIRHVIAGWRMQSIPVSIFLWDNGDLRPPPSDVDLYVKSSVNLKCYPRWHLAAYAASEFICTNDDDLAVIDDKLAERIVARLSIMPEDTIIGPVGMCLKDGKYHFQEVVNDDRRVDVVKGRMACMRRAFLAKVPTWPPVPTEDDIYISSFSKNKFVMSLFNRSWSELRAPHAISRAKGHFERRQAAVDKYLLRGSR